MYVIKNINTPKLIAKMMTTNKLFKVYAITDMIVVIFSLFQDKSWLINTQMAFLGSLLITLASFISYKRLVQRRVLSGAIPEEKKDLLKKIEDPHDLYDDETEESKTDLQEEVEIKKIGLKESLKNLAQSYQSALSPYRIGAYGILFLEVLYLIRHDLLESIPFFIGLSVIPLSSFIGIAFLGIKDKNETNE